MADDDTGRAMPRHIGPLAEAVQREQGLNKRLRKDHRLAPVWQDQNTIRGSSFLTWTLMAR